MTLKGRELRVRITEVLRANPFGMTFGQLLDAIPEATLRSMAYSLEVMRKGERITSTRRHSPTQYLYFMAKPRTMPKPAPVTDKQQASGRADRVRQRVEALKQQNARTGKVTP